MTQERGRGTPAKGMRPPIRVLMVVDSLDVGGAERHLTDVAVRLQELGYSVTVASSADGLLSEELKEQGVSVHVLMHRLVKRQLSVTYARKLRSLLRERRFDLVHAHLYASATASALAMTRLGIPLVVTQHSEAAWRGRRARALSRWTLRRARHVIAVSDGISDSLVREDHVAPQRIAVIHNAVRPLDLEPRSRTHLPEGLGEGPIVGVIARLQPEKGLGVFLQAAAHVLERIPFSQFLVVGDGPLRYELQQRASTLGIRDRIHFLGFQKDARALLEDLDLLVLPSLSEGAPLVVLEAMAAGIPVVASDVGGIAEQLGREDSGILVPPRNPIALSQACIRLLKDPEWAKQLGEAGRKRVALYFNHDAMVGKIEAVYQHVLEASPSASEAVPSPSRSISA